MRAEDFIKYGFWVFFLFGATKGMLHEDVFVPHV